MAALFWLTLLLIILWAVGPAVKRWASPKKSADAIQANLRKIYSPEHEYVETSAGDFQHLDHGFYEKTTRELETEGFRTLGDFEIRTAVVPTISRPTFLRALTDDELIGVGIYNFRAKGLLWWVAPSMRNLKVIDVGTDFSDGNSLTTTNAWFGRHLKGPPQLDTQHHRPNTPLSELLRVHRTRVREYMATHPSATPAVSRTLEEVFEQARQTDRLKAEFRARTNHRLSRAELAGIAEDARFPGTKKAAREIADASEDE